MSKLAADVGAINLAQGFPGFDCDPQLLLLVETYLRDQRNQYAPMAGVPALREAIARKTLDCYQVSYDPDAEITITSGASEAIFNAVTAVVRPGDEVRALPCRTPDIMCQGARERPGCFVRYLCQPCRRRSIVQHQ